MKTAPCLLVVMDRMYAEGGGGTERQVLRLLPLLQAEGWKLEVLFLHPYEWHGRAGFGFPWREIDIGRLLPLGALRAAMAIRRQSRRLGTKLVVTFFSESMISGALARLLDPSLRVVITQRNLGSERSALLHVAAGWAMRRAAGVLVNSAPVREEVLRRYGVTHDKVHTIANLPAARSLQGSSAVVEAAVASFRQRGWRAAVIVANLRPVKGVQDALTALAMEPAAAAPCGLVVCGDGPARPALEAQAIAAGLVDRVRFVGNIEGVAGTLPLFDFAILPSHAEGSANAGLEFAAAGLPFVATAIGGNAELLEQSEGGIPVPPQDPGQLSAAIARLVDDGELRSALAARGRAYAARQPGEKDIVAAHVALFAGLALGAQR